MSREVKIARPYQAKILEETVRLTKLKHNVLIELDCGMGKRFLQLSLINNQFEKKHILLLLQSSASLYETYKYMKDNHSNPSEIGIIDSRSNSRNRAHTLQTKRVVLTLPQTLYNTIKKFPQETDSIDVIVINEIDLLVRRMGIANNLKQPYGKIFDIFSHTIIIGMSGTLRDDHYILDKDQLYIKKELESLMEIIPDTKMIPMDILDGYDLNTFVETSKVIPTGVSDPRIIEVSAKLELMIDSAKKIVLEAVKRENQPLYQELLSDSTKFLSPLPINPDLQTKLQRGYLIRKYLWAMTGEKSKFHLINYGMNGQFVYAHMLGLPGKFYTILQLIKNKSKTVILCSYLDLVSQLLQFLQQKRVLVVTITGQTGRIQRSDALSEFRSSPKQIVAILSNVGERDLDIPEADLLIIYDLVRTTKTVYQKLKRSRGGECRLLFYSETKEEAKVEHVVTKISQKYSWSTEILSKELI